MLTSSSRRSLVFAAIFSVFAVITLPSLAFGSQWRGQENRYERRNDRSSDNYRREKRKQATFINGHDARDGRWDARGPYRKRSFERWERDRNRNRYAYRNRRRYQNRYNPYNRSYDNYDYRRDIF